MQEQWQQLLLPFDNSVFASAAAKRQVTRPIFIILTLRRLSHLSALQVDDLARQGSHQWFLICRACASNCSRRGHCHIPHDLQGRAGQCKLSNMPSSCRPLCDGSSCTLACTGLQQQCKPELLLLVCGHGSGSGSEPTLQAQRLVVA